MKKMSFHIPHSSFHIPHSSFHIPHSTFLVMLLLLTSCASRKQTADGRQTAAYPVFSADSAYAFCAAQCEFGPRTMNSKAHDACGEWIARKFESYGLSVIRQKADLKGYDGTILRATNIVASFRPELSDRILVCAHWDSRPWADNDADEANWRKPVMAANDGASGVAVMLELARLLQHNATPHSDRGSENDSARVAVDFICFDAEDWGVPQWEESVDGDSWALGAQYWAASSLPQQGNYQYGILLDMVGGQGAKFYRESYSMHYARNIVERVWQAANTAGYGSTFPYKDGGGVTDDHVPVNEKAGIPCIDIINHYPDCEQSSFGPTWHTVNDDMQHLDRNTLQAVGQTLVQLIFQR